MGRSQCWLWTSLKWKVPPRCHRQILTLCCWRHSGLHLNNISHTPPRQDIRRIWRASLPQNGQWPIFNSHKFKTYASITGFRHRRITPLWPQANGETERFMRTVKKSIKATLNKGRSWKQELFKFLLDYRTTPHCTTGASPATILFGRTIKNFLPHLITPIDEDSSIRERDTEAKRKLKQYADRKAYVKPNDLRVGETVIVKSDNTSKALTPYQPNPMTIIKKKGSMITATHKGSQTTRNSSFLKKIPKPTANPAHNVLDYPSSEDESYTHTTTSPEYKDNQTHHTTLNLRRSSRTKRPPKRFDH